MTTTPARIVHIITGLSVGGAETMLLKILSRVDRSRFDSVVVSLTKREAVAEKIESLGIKVHSMNIRSGRIPIIGFWHLVRLLRRLKPDIVQGWMYHGNLAAQLAAFCSSKSIPVLWNIRASNSNLSREKFVTALTMWLGARLSGFPIKIINNSRTSALCHERELSYRSGRWVIIPNGFDVKLFTPSREARARFRSSLNLKQDAFLIGLVGRYHPMKDHNTFLKAAAILLRTHTDVHFALIGEGVDPSNRELVKMIDSLNLNSSVHLLGKRDDIQYLTAALDIASSSSSYGEGFPNVIGEAMSCGVPCVVTDVGDSAYIVEGTGEIVPPGNPDKLAGAWREMIDMGDEKRRMLGMLARQRIIEKFSLDSVASQYEELYRKVSTS